MSRQITADQLVDVIYRDVFVAAVQECESILVNPPGRNPDHNALRLKSWFLGLSDEERSMMRRALSMAADHAIFGLLCMIDNVRPIVDGFEHELRLAVETDIETYGIGDGESLHDKFRAKVDSGNRGVVT